MSKLRILTHCALFTTFICAVSPFSVSLPFLPVPVTLQSFALMVSCVTLGRFAVYSTFCYLIIGSMGLPVFAGFQGGAGVLLGPTGGFLAGFIPFSLLLGFYLETRKTKLQLLLSLISANLLLYASGIIWLSLYTGKSFLLTAELCLVFLPGDFVKIAMIISIYERLTKQKRFLHSIFSASTG